MKPDCKNKTKIKKLKYLNNNTENFTHIYRT